MLRTAALLMLCTVILNTSVLAQTNYPLPDHLPPITPDNAAHLKELAALGGLLPNGLAWSPNAHILAVGTSAGVQLYNAADWQAAPHFIPDVQKFFFNTDGELVADGFRWNAQTGENLGALEPPPPQRIFSPSGNIEVQSKQQDNGAVVELHWKDGKVVRLPIPDNADFDQLVFSPDEHYAALVLTEYSDNYPYAVVQLWNVETGIFIADLPQQLDLLDTITFRAGGKLLVTAAYTNDPYGGPFENVSIWDGHTGKLLGPKGLGSLPLHFSPDGTFMAFMMSSDDGISVWTDHDLGLLKYNFEYSDEGNTPIIIFSQDSRTLTTKAGKEILFWSLNTKRVPDAPHRIITTEAYIYSLDYSPDESLLVSTEEGGIIEVWNATTGTRKFRFVASKSVTGAQFSPDGTLLRAGGYNTDTYLWDIQTGKLRLTAPSIALWAADWSQAAYWEGGSVHVVDIATTQETELPVIKDYYGWIVGFSPAADWVIFANQSLTGYHLRSGEQVFNQPRTDTIVQVIFSADGSRFLTLTRSTVAGQEGRSVVNVWNTADPHQPQKTFPIPYYSNGLLLSPDGKWLSQLDGACGDGGGGSHTLWDVEAGKAIAGSGHGDECGPYTHVFSPDGGQLIVGWQSLIGVIDVWMSSEQTASGDDLPPLVGTGISYYPDVYIQGVALSTDGQVLAVSIEQTPYDTPRPEVSHRIELFRLSDVLASTDNDALMQKALKIPDAQSALFSPDSRLLLTDNGVWDGSSGKQLSPVSGKIAAFSPDGALLAIAAKDGITVWDTTSLTQGSASPLTTFKIQGVQELAFNGDATLLYIKRAGDVRLWGIP